MQSNELSMSVEEFREDQMKYLDDFVSYWNRFVETEDFEGEKELDIDEWLEQFEVYQQFIHGSEKLYLGN